MMSSNNPPPPAGWYPDPQGEAAMRWWDGAAWTAHVHQPHAPAAAQAQPAVEGNSFEITQRFSVTLNQYDVISLDGPRPGPVAYVRQKRMAMRERIDLWADASQTQLLCAVQARKVFDIRSTYDVVDGTGRPIGSLRKLGAKSILRSSWEVCAADGQIVARVTETSVAIALVRRVQGLADLIPVVGWLIGLIPIPFGFTFSSPAGLEIGQHRRIMSFRDRYRLTLSPDPDQRFDRRLAIALAVCLDALQSR